MDQVLCVLLWLPNGLTPSVLAPQHDVPWILPKFWVFEVQRLPLAPILRVTQHLVFFYLSPDHLRHLLASSPPYPRANAGALLP